MEFEIDDKIKAALKSKWLGFYKQNLTWIVAQNLHASKPCGNQNNKYNRPNGNLIIPIMIALEPKLEKLVSVLCKFHTFEEIVTILGLDFDPHFALVKEQFESMGMKGVKTINVLPETQEKKL